jgi:divalent metal cation (Fe/Co/Zn/Cd) transporter
MIGALIMMVGMSMLLSSVYSMIRLDYPALNMVLAGGGVAIVCVGYAVNHIVVRRHISKRGYFYW